MKLISTNIGKTMTFQTFSGIKYSNQKLVALLDATTVEALGQDPIAGHIQNLPYMKDPKPGAYTDYLYAKFTDADGTPLYLGIPWTDEDSIVQNTTPNYVITLVGPEQAQVDSLKSMMIANGIENFTIKAV